MARWPGCKTSYILHTKVCSLNALVTDAVIIIMKSLLIMIAICNTNIDWQWAHTLA